MLLGLAYKKNVGEPRESSFFEIRRQLPAKGARLKIFDSWVIKENTVDSLNVALTGVKAILIVTDHDDCIKRLKEIKLSDYGIEVMIDGRNCLDSRATSKQGLIYRGIGCR